MDREIKSIILATKDYKLTIENDDTSQKILYEIRTSLENHNTTNEVLKINLTNTTYYLNNFEYGKIIYKEG